jgi:ribosomal protein S18 acetylase RimI-like enzyme
MLKAAMEELEPHDAIFVAEDENDGQVVGFVRLQTQIDYFSREKLGYISNIAVDKAYEGQGIGRKLIKRAEKWVRDKGFDLLRLHVFVENERAQRIYQENGFQQDIVSYVKRVTR